MRISRESSLLDDGNEICHWRLSETIVKLLLGGISSGSQFPLKVKYRTRYFCPIIRILQL